MKTTLAVLLATGLLAQPLIASAPPYTSEAPIAYMKDLSSGAVLYDKGGQTRIPPASMAKMMTAHVAFRLIQKGDLKLDNKFCCTASLLCRAMMPASCWRKALPAPSRRLSP